MREFRNKIYVIGDNAELSVIIQRELFEQGYHWPSRSGIIPEVQVLICYDDGKLFKAEPEDLKANYLHKNHEIINLSGWRRFRHGAIEKQEDSMGIVMLSDYGEGICQSGPKYQVGNQDVWLSCKNLPKPDHLLIGQKLLPDPRLEMIAKMKKEIEDYTQQIKKIEDEIESEKE